MKVNYKKGFSLICRFDNNLFIEFGGMVSLLFCNYNLCNYYERRMYVSLHFEYSNLLAYFV